MLLKYYLERGVSKAELSRRFGVSRRTIHEWVETGQLDRDLSNLAGGSRYAPRPPAPHKLDPYTGIIDARFEVCIPRLSAQRLFDEVRAAGYAGGYSRVLTTGTTHPRGASVTGSRPSRLVRFETPAGRQGQVDFATFTLPWGRRHALVVVLSHSPAACGCVSTVGRRWSVLTDGLERAFVTRFGGVTKELLFDQMRVAVVLRADQQRGAAFELHVQRGRFCALPRTGDFHPRACRPYRAQTTGKVERPIRYIRDQLLLTGVRSRTTRTSHEQASRWLLGPCRPTGVGTVRRASAQLDRLRAGRACDAASLGGAPSLPASRRPPRCRAGPPARARQPSRWSAARCDGLRGGGGMTATCE